MLRPPYLEQTIILENQCLPLDERDLKHIEALNLGNITIFKARHFLNFQAKTSIYSDCATSLQIKPAS